jgi:hypothetical protein
MTLTKPMNASPEYEHKHYQLNVSSENSAFGICGFKQFIAESSRTTDYLIGKTIPVTVS